MNYLGKVQFTGRSKKCVYGNFNISYTDHESEKFFCRADLSPTHLTDLCMGTNGLNWVSFLDIIKSNTVMVKKIILNHQIRQIC